MDPFIKGVALRGPDDWSLICALCFKSLIHMNLIETVNKPDLVDFNGIINGRISLS